jgi:hypothetical protein
MVDLEELNLYVYVDKELANWTEPATSGRRAIRHAMNL